MFIALARETACFIQEAVYRATRGIMPSIHRPPRNTIPLLMMGLFLTGCASTRSTDLADGPLPASSQAPSHIIVVVSTTTQIDSTPGYRTFIRNEDNQIATMLQAQLRNRMEWGQAGVTITDGSNTAAPRSNTLLLRVTVTQVKAGNQALRLAVGFGAGRATLRLNSQLVDLRGPLPMELTEFNTQSTTGSMPGPGLGLAGAASTGNVIGIAGGSAGLFFGARETMSREVANSSRQIVTCLQTYFGEQGWPAFSPSGPSYLRVDKPLPAPQPLL